MEWGTGTVVGTFHPKHHTIRTGKHWKVGDKFSPRVWSGIPYASKQITIAPDIEIKKIWDFDIKEMATIRSLILKDVWAEGIVIRPYAEKIDLLLSNENFNNGRVSFKAINPEFLLKYGE